MRFLAGAGLLVVGLLVATWAVTVFALLTRSPDSGWVNGVEYAGPFFLGGSLAIAAGARLLRAKAVGADSRWNRVTGIARPTGEARG